MLEKHAVTPEFLARFTQAWNDHDLDTLMAHMDEHCEFMASVGDGLSNTLLIGEMLPEWHDHFWDGSWTHFNGGNSHVGTIVPINYVTDERSRCGSNPLRSFGNWNLSWGFKSRHTGGANFVLGDGSVRFITSTIDHRTYQYLGARADGQAVSPP